MASYKQGDRGEVVKQIQRVAGAYPDGVWGVVTTECVKQWQQAHGLTPDGIVGPATMAKMGISSVGALVSSPKVMRIESSGVVLKASRRRIDHIVVHCTATPEGKPLTVEQIRREHKAQGWSDIGYHYVVTLDGRLHLGRDVDVAGAHVNGHNAHTIGVAYVGGLENRPGVPYAKLPAKDTRTGSQKSTLLSLLMDLHKLYPYAKICGHRDFSPDKNHDGVISVDEYIKDCPSFDAKTEYRKI